MKTKVSFKNAFLAGLMAAGAAAVVNAILFFVFHAAGLITDNIEISPGQHMTVVPVIMSSILPTVLGTLVFWLLERFTKRGLLIFTILATVLLLVSLGGPFSIVNVTVAYAMALNAMHVVVVAILLFFLRRAVKKAATN